MDPRTSADRQSHPSAGNRSPQPATDAAERRFVAPVTDEDEWTIGVSDTPPWELVGTTDRPPALPAEQPAPWEAARRDAAPWERREVEAPGPKAPQAAPQSDAAPWDRPTEYQPAPWDAQPAQAAAVPWDRPAPFSASEARDEADPYDASAPVLRDVREYSVPRAFAAAPPAEAVAPAGTLAPSLPAAADPVADDPELDWWTDEDDEADVAAYTSGVPEPNHDVAEPLEDLAEPIDDAAEPMQAVAEPMQAVAEPMQAVAEPIEAPAEPISVEQAGDPDATWFDDFAAWDQPVDAGDSADVADGAEADETVEPYAAQADPEPEPRPDPLEWPPVPTDIELKPKAAEPPPPPDPIEWPPIPTDIFRAPAPPSQMQAWNGASLWQAAPATDGRSLAAAAAVVAEPADVEPQAPEPDADPFDAWEVAAPPQAGGAPATTYAPTTDPTPDVWDDWLVADPALASQPEQPAFSSAVSDPVAPSDDEVGEWATAGETAFDPHTTPPAPEPAPEPTVAEEPAHHGAEAGNAPAIDDADDDAWMLGGPSPAQTGGIPTWPPTAAPPSTGESRGAVFARYAAAGSSDAAPSALADRAESGDPGNDLWFLANEPSPAEAGGETGEAEPSSVQTAVATVLVAGVVIGLVILFLLLFTSFFG